MKRKSYLLLLVIIDQSIKVIIYLWFMNSKATYFNNKIGFTPYINRSQLSIFNHEFNLGIGVFTLNTINILCIILLVIIYKFLKRREYTNVYYEITFLFIMSGTLCSLLDKTIYKGSIDYILFGRHIYDLKDIYLCLAVIFLTVYIFTYLKHEIKIRKL